MHIDMKYPFKFPIVLGKLFQPHNSSIWFIWNYVENVFG